MPRVARILTAISIAASVVMLIACLAYAQEPQADQASSALRKIFIPGAVSPAPVSRPSGAFWLNYVNSFRAMAGVPPLVEKSEWSYGGQMHARYMVKNDVVGHSENSGMPWYTPEGSAAAGTSNLVATSQSNMGSDEWAINSWMVAPFHAVSMLDPELQYTGYGSYNEAGGGVQWAAAFDVLRGRVGMPAGIRYPILFPGPGSVVPFRQHWPEAPEPLTSCPGYQTPSGLPVMVQVGDGSKNPQVNAHAFYEGGTALEHCVFTESTYYNPDGGLQGLGRSILGSRDAVLLIPRAPLKPNTTYTVALTVDGASYRWSFSVGNVP